MTNVVRFAHPNRSLNTPYARDTAPCGQKSLSTGNPKLFLVAHSLLLGSVSQVIAVRSDGLRCPCVVERRLFAERCVVEQDPCVPADRIGQLSKGWHVGWVIPDPAQSIGPPTFYHLVAEGCGVLGAPSLK